jgi:hypothetical protein
MPGRLHRNPQITDWSLEIVDAAGGSTVWDCFFPTDQAAFDEAMRAIREEGIRAFVADEPPCIDFYASRLS